MSRPHALFVAGTDTGVGKTMAALAMLERARQDGLRAIGLKPVAAGCVVTPEGLVNDDALRLRALSGVPLSYPQVNPCILPQPIAPHLAAQAAGVQIDLASLAETVGRVFDLADLAVVEGVGGWLVPLAGRTTMADLVRRLDLPVVLVVGLRLGCLNHALLTAGSVLQHGCRLCGWVASTIDPAMPAIHGNLQTLSALLPAPLLGLLPHAPGASPEELARHVRLPS